MRKNDIFFSIKLFDNFFSDNLFINLKGREKNSSFYCFI